MRGSRHLIRQPGDSAPCQAARVRSDALGRARAAAATRPLKPRFCLLASVAKNVAPLSKSSRARARSIDKTSGSRASIAINNLMAHGRRRARATFDDRRARADINKNLALNCSLDIARFDCASNRTAGGRGADERLIGADLPSACRLIEFASGSTTTVARLVGGDNRCLS